MEHQPPDEDMMDEDMELQLALALSLQVRIEEIVPQMTRGHTHRALF